MAKVAGREIRDAKVAVVGMAKSGMAAVDLLLREGARPVAIDQKPIENLGPAAQFLRERAVDFRLQTDDCCNGFDLVVVSPGVPFHVTPLRAARQTGIPVIGELELASYFLKGRILAITGSNGKTTTTALAYHILAQAGIPAQLGGNIGTPVCTLVASSRPGQWNVLEVSSFQLETISNFRADIAVALNVTPDHLDRHGTMEAYEAAKGRLFETQQPHQFAILNADDPVCVRYASLTRGRALWFSMTRAVTPGIWIEEEKIYFDERLAMPAAEIPLRGRHNVANVMAAVAAARLAGADLDRIVAAVKSFPGVEHRLEFIRSWRGVDWYNDSKATNVDAALKAIDAFAGGLWVILGGKDKDGDYRPLGLALRRKARGVLLIGAAADKIAGHLSEAAPELPLIPCGTLPAAVEYASRHASPGDTVLLSPACASFDQFENFEHRGQVFKHAVATLPDETRSSA
jgi:UDP-N-acetylmuramoylalanine--D-glutamate ligase